MKATLNSKEYDIEYNDDVVVFREITKTTFNELMDYYRSALCLNMTSEGWEGEKRFIPQSSKLEGKLYTLTVTTY